MYIYLYIYLIIHVYICIVGRVFPTGLRDRGSLLGWIILTTQKVVLYAALLNTEHYKAWIKGNWSNPRKKNTTLLHFGVGANEKGTFESPLTKVANITFFAYVYTYI